MDEAFLLTNIAANGAGITPITTQSHDVDYGNSTTNVRDKKVISHEYNDLSWVTEDDATVMFPPFLPQSNLPGGRDGFTGEEDAKLRKRKLHTKKNLEPFPLKLHRMLDTVEAQGRSHIMSWQPHGRAFRVHHVKAFVDLVLPQYCKQKKIHSFHRQLQLYGFMRITHGPDVGAYYHERFLIGRPFLARSMCRTKCKGLFQKPIIDSSTEPNFYEMPHLERPKTTLDPELVPSKEAEQKKIPTSCDKALRESIHVEGGLQSTQNSPLENTEARKLPPLAADQDSGSVELTEMAMKHLHNMGFAGQNSTRSNVFENVGPPGLSSLLGAIHPCIEEEEQNGSIWMDHSKTLPTPLMLRFFVEDK